MYGSRCFQRDVHERQQESGCLHREQHTAVEGMKALAAEQQFVCQIEYGLKNCHLYYIYEEHSHCDSVYRLALSDCLTGARQRPARHGESG